MSFEIGLSGINAASASLSTASHNIANVGTTGFKYSRAEFADIFSNNVFSALTATATLLMATVSFCRPSRPTPKPVT